jgi:hypothetical protein
VGVLEDGPGDGGLAAAVVSRQMAAMKAARSWNDLEASETTALVAAAGGGLHAQIVRMGPSADPWDAGLESSQHLYENVGNCWVRFDGVPTQQADLE